MALLMFDAAGERRLPEPSTTECEAIKLHNWIECARSSGRKTSIKTELTEATAQRGRYPESARSKGQYQDCGLPQSSAFENVAWSEETCGQTHV